jgi:hypothetical protein
MGGCRLTIHISEKQAALWFNGDSKPKKGKKPPNGGGSPRKRKKKSELPENKLETVIEGFLTARRWKIIRQHVGTYVPLGRIMSYLESEGGVVPKAAVFRNIVRIGSKGDPDWLAVRPKRGVRGVYELFFYEAKAPGEKPKPEQLQRLKELAAAGYTAAWFDNYDDGFDTSFLPWYTANFPGEV